MNRQNASILYFTQVRWDMQTAFYKGVIEMLYKFESFFLWGLKSRLGIGYIKGLMRLISFVPLFVVSLFLSSCQTMPGGIGGASLSLSEMLASTGDKLKAAAKAGTGDSGLHKHLAEEYHSLALLEANIMQNKENARYFSQKAQAARRGGDVSPEKPVNHKTPDFAREKMEVAREQLLEAMTFAAPGPNNVLLARAQARYDCWLIQREAQPDPAYEPSCRSAFYEALRQVDMTPADNERYAVYFDYNSAALNSLAMTVVRDMAQRHEDRPGWQVVLTGIVDGASNEYNNKLANRRIIAVKNALMLYGMAPDHIISDGAVSAAKHDSGALIDPKTRRVDVLFRPAVVAGRDIADPL